jgi:CheY-like chemotaxis protein
VLLVEDEPAVRSLAARVLERSGYTVHAASDGEEAVDLLDRLETVDVLVTDVVMPGMNGRELADRVRVRLPRLPVIYMSGYTADEAIRENPAPHGHFLEKPFTPDQLAREVRGALDG